MKQQGNNWVAYSDDCMNVIKQLPNDYVHLTISSFPFADLYTYSDDPRDFSNVKDLDEYFKQLDYLIPELYRITRPNRLICLHVKQLATFKGRDGAMGLIDFRGMMIQAFQKHGWTYHGEITIWTDPQIEATRTKAASLLWNSYKKFAEITRTGMPDYIIVMQKVINDDETTPHVTHEHNDENFKKWTKLASPVWGLGELTPSISRTNVLNAKLAKEDKDERHMTPLQLDTIEHLIEWYSNKDEIVFDPFAGVMSVPYQAVKMNRRGLGVELKDSYFKTGINFLKEVESYGQLSLFDMEEDTNGTSD